MNRQGFTLIEVLIALAITGFMATILFTALFQINTGVKLTESLMSVNEKAARLEQLFERDLTGATTLIDNELPQKQPVDSKMTNSSENQTPTPEETTSMKKDKKVIKKIFYGTSRGNQLGTLTFISNNPLLGFCPAPAGTLQSGPAKPYLVRITYNLEEDPAIPDSYILTRQESAPLDFEQRTGRTYAVLDGIKNLKFKYTAKTIKKDTAAQQQKQTEEILYTSGLTTWNSDESSDANNKKEPTKERKFPIPAFIDIETTLWDDARQQEYSYNFTVEIITDTEFVFKRRAWAFMSLFDKPDQGANKTPKQAPSPTPKPPMPMQPQKSPSNNYVPNSELQKQLEEAFKTAQSYDKRMTL